MAFKIIKNLKEIDLRKERSQLPLNVPFTLIYYQKAVSYSFMILGGIDNPYTGVSELILNISTFESVWGNLFIVFVVGRLLTKKGYQSGAGSAAV